MQCIRGMYPHNIIHRDKLRKYLHFRQERAEFMRGLSKMRHCDWVIHKKLSGEHDKLTCLYFARGNGKWAHIDEFLAFVMKESVLDNYIE